VSPSGLEILLRRCFKGCHEDQVLGWNISTREVVDGGHRHFLRGSLEPVDQEQKLQYIATLKQRIGLSFYKCNRMIKCISFS